jgi:hypothetical protein
VRAQQRSAGRESSTAGPADGHALLYRHRLAKPRHDPAAGAQTTGGPGAPRTRTGEDLSR